MSRKTPSQLLRDRSYTASDFMLDADILHGEMRWREATRRQIVSRMPKKQGMRCDALDILPYLMVPDDG
jgi:hypothetical protein